MATSKMAISQILIILLFSSTIFYLASVVNAVTYTVTGKIYCHHDKEIVTGAKVEFYELDPYFDDFWDSAFTDENGEFSVAGSESEFENEAPYLWIIHKCGSEALEDGHVHRSRLPIVGDFNEDVYHFRMDIFLFVGIYKVNDGRGGVTKWRMKTDSSTRNKDDIPDYALRIIPPESPTDEECKRRNSQSECEHDQQHDGCLWSDKKQSCSLCQAFLDEEVHILCDKICLSCHEMFSDKQPNFRAECSDNCYKNNKFRQCVEIFPHSDDNLKLRSLLMDMNDEEENSDSEN